MALRRVRQLTFSDLARGLCALGPWPVCFGSLDCVPWVHCLCARSSACPGGPRPLCCVSLACVPGFAGLCALRRMPVRFVSQAGVLCVAGLCALRRWPVCLGSLACVLWVPGLRASSSVCLGGPSAPALRGPSLCASARVASQACALCVAGRCALCRWRARWPVLCVAGGTFRDFAKGAVGTSRTRSTSTTGRAGSTARAWPGSSTIARLS